MRAILVVDPIEPGGDRQTCQSAELAGVEIRGREIGGATLINDDRSLGDLSSLVEMQNPTSQDAPAYVLVSNKELYGQAMTYTLRVSDVSTGDAYEVDDVEGVPIGLGVPQERTFSPTGDVDRVHFIAKADHRYAIYTENLAPRHIAERLKRSVNAVTVALAKSRKFLRDCVTQNLAMQEKR